MAQSDPLAEGRAAFERREWAAARDRLAAAEADCGLGPADLELLAAATYLTGQEDRAIALWTRLHHDCVNEGQTEQGAAWGFRLAMLVLLRGEFEQANGWLARGERLLGGRDARCAAAGYGLIARSVMAMMQGEFATCLALTEDALALGESSANPDLLALGLLGNGQALVHAGRTAEGTARLDEAMLTVTVDDVSPVVAGIVYCAVILTCQGVFDLRRAVQWTRELDRWCASQPDLVPYRGRCLVHRSEVLLLHGDWDAAIAEAVKARDHLSDGGGRTLGHACYQLAELHRLRGDIERADALYREADGHGREPQPGLALLNLTRGNPEAALTAMRGAVESASGTRRAGMLGPYAHILLAAGQVDEARAAAEELARVAADMDAPLLRAISTQATGAVLVAEGKLQAAHTLLRESLLVWQDLENPYEMARVRASLAHVCREMGDVETARLHLDAARSAFEALEAFVDLRALEEPEIAEQGMAGGLTEREREVLALVAGGRTNRQIGASLGISEHTVARHISNIFNKVGVTTRTQATAVAYRDGLVPGAGNGQS